MPLHPAVLADLDSQLAPVDAALASRAQRVVAGRQPVHTVYVAADAMVPDLPAAWGARALAALAEHPPAPFPDGLRERIEAKLRSEPIEDLRVDFEDGFGVRADDVEDAWVDRAVAALLAGPLPPFVGLRCKSLEAATRHRAVRTVDRFLAGLLAAGPLPAGFVVTLPKVSAAAQVAAMVTLCSAFEREYGLPAGLLRFETQVEVPAAVLDLGGLITAAAGRCVGLHYGTYDYSAACGIAAAYQASDHPVADHAKAVMQVVAAGTGVRVVDGSTNVVPVGTTAGVHAAWAEHHRLVSRALVRGFYQGWDLHPAQLPTRYAATYAFFRDGLPTAGARLAAYLGRQATGVLDEPATARAMAGFLLRGLDCGALDEAEVPFDRRVLERL